MKVHNKYSNYCPTNNMTLYLNGKAVDTISWDVNRSDYGYEYGFIPEDTLWDNYNGKSYSMLNLVYPGDEKFNPVNITKSIAVSSVKCNIKNAIVNVAISSDTSGVLTVKANGKTYTKSIKATYESQYSKYAPKSYEFDLKGLLKYGANSIEVTFSDNSKRYSFKDTFKYTSKCLIEITSAIPIEVQYANTKTVSLKAYKTNGKPVGKNQVIKIKIGRKTYTAKTNKNGIAKFKIPKTLTSGTHKMTLTYKTSKLTKKITVHIVNLKTVTVKKSAKKLTLKATLAKVNGKYLKNKQVTFRFHGKTYKAKTNSKGVAKATVKSSVLKKLAVGKTVTYQATYLKDTVKKSAKVKR